jgi:hypothetical protein
VSRQYFHTSGASGSSGYRVGRALGGLSICRWVRQPPENQCGLGLRLSIHLHAGRTTAWTAGWQRAAASRHVSFGRATARPSSALARCRTRRFWTRRAGWCAPLDPVGSRGSDGLAPWAIPGKGVRFCCCCGDRRCHHCWGKQPGHADGSRGSYPCTRVFLSSFCPKGPVHRGH